MAKFNELKAPQLKKELEERGLATNKLKTKLQGRLRETMEEENINVDKYAFKSALEESTMKIEKQKETQCSSMNIDMNKILDAKSQMISQFSSQLGKCTSKKLEEQEARILTQMTAQISEENNKIKAEVNELKNRICELQLNRPIMPTGSAKIKPPSFDGTTPFQIFKLQFEKTASANNWNAENKVAALMLALKWPAAEILQTIPNCESSSYETLMGAVERRYGIEHKKQIFQIELVNRQQKANESLQEFALEIAKLAQLAHAHKSVEYIENIKIQCFVNGIREETIRYAALACPKLTFAETVSYALQHETAFLLCKQAHQVEIEEPLWANQLIVKMDKLLEKYTATRKKNVGVVKCFNCGKKGHIARNCNIKSNQSHYIASVSIGDEL